MNFELDAEQSMFKKSVREFLKRELPSDTMLELLESEQGYSEKMWRKMAQLGWFGLMLPDEYKGSEYGFSELALLMEDMGYFLYSGPFFATVVLGAPSILSYGNTAHKKELLPKIAEGKMRLTLAVIDPDARYKNAAAIVMPAQKNDTGYTLNGTKLFVPDAHIADYILCAARTEDSLTDGITVFLVDAKTPGISITALDNISKRRQSQVDFVDVKVTDSSIVGSPGKGWEIVEQAFRCAALARSCEMVGGAQAALDSAIEHAKTRVQFKRPIGSFQAIQHHVTNMWISIINARVLCQKAASQMDNGLDAQKTIAMAKIKAGESLRFVSAKAHQILGAVGYCQEYDTHFYFRRAIVDDLTFGDRSFQQNVIAGCLGI